MCKLVLLFLMLLLGFLSGRVQRVLVDGIHSENVRVISGVPQSSVLGPLLFLLYITDLPIILENTLVGYADDYTLLVEVPEPGSQVEPVLSLNSDLARICDWCKRWGLLVNPMKNMTMLITMSKTLAPIFPNLFVGWHCGGKGDRVEGSRSRFEYKTVLRESY